MTPAPAVLVEDLSKCYTGRGSGPRRAVQALEGVSLAVEAGSVLALLGPNGAGKTTLVRILTTVLPADGGTAMVAGHDVAAGADAVRSVIGVAGQSATVDPLLTGRENLELVGRLHHLGKDPARQRAGELLSAMDLTGDADRAAQGYSGGMRRRLDLAASLVGRPRVLFLDEPTAGLDPRSRLGLWEILEQLVAEGTSVLLTTQYLEEADRLADRVAVLDHGRVVAEGPPEQLKDKVGPPSLLVRLADAASCDAAAATLAPVVADAIEVDVSAREILVPASAHAMLGMLRRLDEAGVAIEEATLCRPSLDDVFLALTGQDGVPNAPQPRPPATPTAVAPADARTLSAPPSRQAPPRRTRLAWALFDTAAMAKRNLLRYPRIRPLLVSTIVQPISFVLLFVAVFSGAVEVPGISYIEFVLPGVWIQTVLFESAHTGAALAEEASTGILDRFRALPMARSAYLAGRVVADAARNAAVLVLLTAVGFLVGFRFSGGMAAGLFALVLAIGFGLAFSWISAMIGLSVRDAEATGTTTLVWMIPLVFLSSAFVPVDTMPAAVEALAEANPVTSAVDAARSLSLGRAAAGHVAVTMAWIAGLLAVFFPLALRQYRRS